VSDVHRLRSEELRNEERETDSQGNAAPLDQDARPLNRNRKQDSADPHSKKAKPKEPDARPKSDRSSEGDIQVNTVLSENLLTHGV
jgi:hypothetical protein